MRTIFLPSIVVLTLGTWAGVAPADAQAPVCPAGYYYASDGQCYPGGPPVYPPPVYAVEPPVYQPPLVLDGLALGIGLGAVFGGDRGHDYGGHDGHGGHH